MIIIIIDIKEKEREKEEKIISILLNFYTLYSSYFHFRQIFVIVQHAINAACYQSRSIA